jgi:hypothetical protein
MQPHEHVDRHIPAEANGGWGFATGIIVLALICIASATYIHKKTYKHPTDVTWHSGGDRASASSQGR